MSDVWLGLAALLLAGTFAWSGSTKIVRADRWREDLKAYRLPRAVRVPAFLVVPWIEVGIAAAILAGAFSPAGVVAVVLLVLFSAAIVWARIRVGTNEIGCGCFGGARKRDYRLLLARNVSLAAVAVVAVWSGGRADLSADLVGEPNAVPWVLVMVAAVGCFWVVWQVSRRVRHEGRPRVAATRAVPGSGGTVERRGG